MTNLKTFGWNWRPFILSKWTSHEDQERHGKLSPAMNVEFRAIGELDRIYCRFPLLDSFCWGHARRNLKKDINPTITRHLPAHWLLPTWFDCSDNTLYIYSASTIYTLTIIRPDFNDASLGFGGKPCGGNYCLQSTFCCDSQCVMLKWVDNHLLWLSTGRRGAQERLFHGRRLF